MQSRDIGEYPESFVQGIADRQQGTCWWQECYATKVYGEPGSGESASVTGPRIWKGI